MRQVLESREFAFQRLLPDEARRLGFHLAISLAKSSRSLVEKSRGLARSPARIMFSIFVLIPGGEFINRALALDVHEIHLRMIEEEMAMKRSHIATVVERS